MFLILRLTIFVYLFHFNLTQSCKTIIENKDICCNGVIQPLFGSDRETTGCCGLKSYDTRTQVCCCAEKGTGYTGFTTGIFLKVDDMCIDGEVYDKTDSERQCCGKIMYSKNAGEECCGGTVIDQASICCNENVQKLYVNKEMTKCCGNVSYFYWDTMCCDNNVPINKGVYFSEGYLTTILPNKYLPDIPPHTGFSYCCLRNEKDVQIIGPQYQYDKTTCIFSDTCAAISPSSLKQTPEPSCFFFPVFSPLNECCYQLNVCYSSCEKSKQTCDTEFQKCTQNFCTYYIEPVFKYLELIDTRQPIPVETVPISMVQTIMTINKLLTAVGITTLNKNECPILTHNVMNKLNCEYFKSIRRQYCTCCQ